MGKYSNNGNKIYPWCKNNYKKFIVFVRVIRVEVFYASYAYMLIAEKLVWTKSKEPCT